MSQRCRAGGIVMVCLVLGCAHRGPATKPASEAATTTAPPAADQGPAALSSGVSSPYAALDQARASLATFHAAEGQAVAGGDTTRWLAYTDGDSLRYIREVVENPVYGKRTNEYVFAGGRLRVFASSGGISLTGPLSERGPYRMRIAFDSGGNMIAAEKIVSEKPVSIEPSEPPAAIGRSDWLRAQLQAGVPSGR